MMQALATYQRRGWALTQLHGVDDQGVCTCGRNDDQHRKQAGKHPTRGSWEAHGLTDWPAIEQLWTQAPGMNVGIVTGRPSGIWVLDIDPDNGGDAGLAMLEAANGPLPQTYEVKTGSGGRHLYFAMPVGLELGNGRGSLPTGIDVRGTGGQVVAPPSRSGIGPYSVAVEVQPVEAPAWLLLVIATPRERVSPQPAYDGQGYEIGAESGAETARLRAYASGAMRAACAALARAAVGERNQTAFAVACQMIEVANAPWAGVTVEQAWGMFWTAGHGAEQPLDDAELGHCWSNARARVGARPRDYPGLGDLAFSVIDGPAPYAFDEFATPGGGLVSAVAGPTSPVLDPVEAFLGRLLTPAMMRQLPPLEPLVDGFLYLDTMAWIIGKSGDGKSFVMLDLALHVATGRDWQGHPTRRGTVMYVAAEGARGVSPRVDAWSTYYGLTDGDVEGLLVYPMPVQAADPLAWGVMVEVARRLQPALIVLDTQARVTVGLEENSNTTMGQFVEACEMLRRAAQSTVALVHHVNSAGEARGASALRGSAQTELTVSKAGSAITVKTTKQKDTIEAEPVELRFEAIPTAGPDGSVMLVAAAKVSASSLEEIADRVRAEETSRSQAMTVLAEVMGDTFAEGRGGTKAEVRAVWENVAAGRGVAKGSSNLKRSFYRTWNKALDAGMISRVQGTQSFRWVPTDERFA